MNEQRNAPIDRPWTTGGSGSMVSFKCGARPLPKGTRGSGLRRVAGLRTRVCEGCRTVIDARVAAK